MIGLVAPRTPFVVVTGLAGAGKSTLAVPLARALDIPLVSKDAITEGLFDSVGIGDRAWASTMSRAADAALVEIAAGLEAAVLDNYWRPEMIERLLDVVTAPMVEVYCRIDPAVAAARFAARARHAGHSDDEREQTVAPPSAIHRFPVRVLGPMIEVDGTSPVDIDLLAAEIVAVGA
jgi:predicted kinase